MRKQPFALWFCIVSVILILFGILYVFVGLKVLPVRAYVLLDWESALYGALMIGWGTTLLLIGRLAFQRDEKALKQALLIGLLMWLAVEAAASAWFGVWFNVGVDAVRAVCGATPQTLDNGPREPEIEIVSLDM